MEPTSDSKPEAKEAVTGKREKPAKVPAVREAALPFSVLVQRRGLNAPVVAGLRAAHAWTDATPLTPAEFERQLAAWLNAPAERS